MGPENWLQGQNHLTPTINLDPKKRPKDKLVIFQEKALKDRPRSKDTSTLTQNGSHSNGTCKNGQESNGTKNEVNNPENEVNLRQESLEKNQMCLSCVLYAFDNLVCVLFLSNLSSRNLTQSHELCLALILIFLRMDRSSTLFPHKPTTR